jgi:hypothetical protein
MHKSGSAIEIKVKNNAANVTNELSQRESQYSNEWRKIEANLVTAAT